MTGMSPSRVRAHYVLAGLAVAFAVWTFAVGLLRETPPKGHPWVGIAALALAGHLVVQTHVHATGSRFAVLAVLLPLGAIGAAAVAAFTDW